MQSDGIDPSRANQIEEGGKGGATAQPGELSGSSIGGQSGEGNASSQGGVGGKAIAPEQLCGQQEQSVVALCSESDLRALVVGEWWHCTGWTAYRAKDGVGIEIAADGSWYALRKSETGEIVRGGGLDYQGVWTTVDTTAMNGPCAFQVEFRDATGVIPAIPAFSLGPRKMRLSSTAGLSDWVALRE